MGIIDGMQKWLMGMESSTTWMIIIICIAIIFALAIAIRVIINDRRAFSVFDRRLSQSTIKRLRSSGQRPRTNGESKEITVLFAKINGIISNSHMRDEREFIETISRYLRLINKVAMDNHGTLGGRSNDALIAFWNAPLDDRHHAENAIESAFEMMRRLRLLDRELSESGLPALHVTMGINTGTAIVGDISGNQMFDYTCIGDDVNLASRFVGQCKSYGVDLVIGEKTRNLIRDEYYTVELDAIPIKGRFDPEKIYTVFQLNPRQSRIFKVELSQHNVMLNAFRSRRFGVSHALAKEQLGSFGGALDQYYRIWMDRCKKMQDNSSVRDEHHPQQ